MRIDGYQNFFGAGELAGQSFVRENQKGGRFQGDSTPAMGDTASISSAAKDAQQTAKSQGSGATDSMEAFRKYMHKARGGIDSSSGGSLEALEARLKDLEKKLASIAADQNMPEQTKNSMIQAIQDEISQITSQIAELKAQVLKMA